MARLQLSLHPRVLQGRNEASGGSLADVTADALSISRAVE
jgi:hypothetical protein